MGASAVTLTTNQMRDSVSLETFRCMGFGYLVTRDGGCHGQIALSLGLGRAQRTIG